MKKSILSILVVSVLLGVSAWRVSEARNFQLFGDLISRIDTNDKIVALTFDDGPWSTEYTNEVIGILDELNIKGTFFLNGMGIENNLSAAMELVAAGHQIGNHSFSHKRMVFRGFTEVKREVDSTSELIRKIGFEGEIFFRPPYGKKLFTLPYYLKKNNITSVTWDVEPETYPEVSANPEYLASYVVNVTKPGSIILLHVLGSNNQVSRDSIRLLVRGLKAKGFEFVTVSELVQKNS